MGGNTFQHLRDKIVDNGDWSTQRFFEVGEDKLHVLFNPVTGANNFFTYDYNTNKTNSVTTGVSAETNGQKGKIVRRDKGTDVYKVDSQNGYGNEISLETLVVLDYCLGFVDNFNKVLTDPVWNETSTLIVKYAPFLTIDCKKYKKVVLETMNKKL